MLAGSLLVKIAHPWDENRTHLRTSRYQDDLELRARTYRMEAKYCLVVKYNIRTVWSSLRNELEVLTSICKKFNRFICLPEGVSSFYKNCKYDRRRPTAYKF